MTAPVPPLSAEDRCELIAEPDPMKWGSMVADFVSARPAWAAEFRRELGLPVDTPIVLSGHQAQFWHPGILSKWFATVAAARSVRGTAAWIVVDQDVNDASVVRLPVRRAMRDDGGDAALTSGRLRVESWRLGSVPSVGAADVPTGRRPPIGDVAVPVLGAGESWATPGVESGVEAIRTAMNRHAEASSLARQVAAAAAHLLTDLEPDRAGASGAPLEGDIGTGPRLLWATAVSRTRLFASIIERIRFDPQACVRAYNAAVRAHPRERIQPLEAGEVPLWVIGDETVGGAARRRATVNDLSRPASELAPRALLMTGLLRYAACDLFIHGTGGGGGGHGHAGYDRITERWFAGWRAAPGDPPFRLAPSVVTTATLRLRLPGSGPGPDELRRAQWLAHRAMHEPAVLGDNTAASEKRAMVERIRSLKRAGGDAKPIYREMHELLRRVRGARSGDLERLRAVADSAARRLGDAQIASDRTWAFPLYGADRLLVLRGEVERAVGGQG